MANSKLTIYNDALIELGQTRLSVSNGLSEDREARYILDAVYDNVITECLQAGDWNFATREVQAASDTGVTESFGFTETIGKPTDWIRTVALSDTENHTTPMLATEYEDNTDHWATNSSPIYVKYISNDSSWGLSLTAWPWSFTRYVIVSLAERGCMAITHDDSLQDRLTRLTLPRAKRSALSKDAVNQGTRFPRVSSWNNSRGSRNGRERGRWNQFTG